MSAGVNDFLQRLKRKLVQWAVAYVAMAFALLQGIDIVAQRFAGPESVEPILIIAICIGFFVTLLLAWYHGEQGRQRASGTESLLIALLLAAGGGLLWKFAGVSGSDAPRKRATHERVICLRGTQWMGCFDPLGANPPFWAPTKK